ncbi:MAG: hypothetical protein KYX62_18515 [Pseudomonadota bacterium]|nr:hypothetical protein [Pseudomonadota bacterium]
MILHQSQFESYLKAAGVGSRDSVADSVKSYISYLNGVSKHLDIEVSPKTLRSNTDIAKLEKSLQGKVSDKTIQNYKSAMRQYVSMVESHGL